MGIGLFCFDLYPLMGKFTRDGARKSKTPEISGVFKLHYSPRAKGYSPDSDFFFVCLAEIAGEILEIYLGQRRLRFLRWWHERHLDVICLFGKVRIEGVEVEVEILLELFRQKLFCFL